MALEREDLKKIADIVEKEVFSPHGSDRYTAASEEDVRKIMRKLEKIEDILYDIKKKL